MIAIDQQAVAAAAVVIDDDVTQVWTMVAIYLAVACVGVIIVAVFVDNLPSDLVDSKTTNIRSEV